MGISDWSSDVCASDLPADMLVEAEALLEELHRRLSSRWFIDLPAQMERGESLPPMSGEAMREPIFYGGEAALSFQYLDFALLKYREDNDWLVAHRGFRIEDAATEIGRAACRGRVCQYV